MAEKRDLVAKSRLINEMSLKNRLIEYFTQWEVLLSIIIVLVFIFSPSEPRTSWIGSI